MKISISVYRNSRLTFFDNCDILTNRHREGDLYYVAFLFTIFFFMRKKMSTNQVIFQQINVNFSIFCGKFQYIDIIYYQNNGTSQQVEVQKRFRTVGVCGSSNQCLKLVINILTH